MEFAQNLTQRRQDATPALPLAHLHCNTPALAGGARERSAAQCRFGDNVEGGAREV